MSAVGQTEAPQEQRLRAASDAAASGEFGQAPLGQRSKNPYSFQLSWGKKVVCCCLVFSKNGDTL